jgi:hypothetical protein
VARPPRCDDGAAIVPACSRGPALELEDEVHGHGHR